MHHHPHGRLAWFAIGALVLANSVTPLAVASSAKPPLRVDEAVGQALKRAEPRTTVYDDSSGAIKCTSVDPAPVVDYRSDRIMLRTNLAEDDIRADVNASITSIGGKGKAGTIEFIAPPEPAPAPGPGQATLTGPVSSDRVATFTPVVVVSIKGRVNILALVRFLRSEYSILASPDYLLSPSSGPTGMWPFGYPSAPTYTEGVRAAGIGYGVSVWIFDTGLPPLAQGHRAPNLVALTPADETEQLDSHAPQGIVDIFSGGHTLALADVIHTLAPATAVGAAKITDVNGVATDDSALRRMVNALRDEVPEDWPELIVNAFGSPVCDLDPASPAAGELGMLGLEAMMESINARSTTMVVAAAGNRSSSRQFYPASFSLDFPTTVLGVGAIDTMDPSTDPNGDNWSSTSRSGPPASFSNYGRWVTAWAPGVQLSTRHVIGYKFTANGPTIQGQAIVSGTSFAAPYVAALIAERIVSGAHVGDPRAAWADVNAAGKICSQGVGGGTAVALTAMSDSATTKSDLPAAC